MKNITNLENNIDFLSIIMGLSVWTLLFTYEGSFMVQSIAIFLLIELLIIFKRKVLKLNFKHKLLIILLIIVAIATIINLFLNPGVAGINGPIGILYFAVIVFWYICNTQEVYNSKSISFIINNYIIVTTIASLITIYYSIFLGTGGKIELINFLGTVIDENYSSALISITPILLLTKILYSRKNKLSIKYIIINILLFIINFFALLLIGSRAAFLACIIALIFLLITFFYTKITTKRIVFSMIAFVVLILGFSALINYIPEWTYNRYFINSYSDNSNEHRLQIWSNAITAVSDQPLFGYGFGVYNSSFSKYDYLPWFSHTPSSAPAHQTYLDILVYGGFSGFCVFIIFMISSFKRIVKKKYWIVVPLAFIILFISNVIGADKSVFFWNNLILIEQLLNYIEKNGNIEECFI